MKDKINLADLNAKIAIAYGIILAVLVLLFIAFRLSVR